MAYKFSTGFDFYTNASQIWQVLNSGGTISSSFARFPAITGATSQGIQTSHGQVIYNLPFGSISTGVVGFAFQTNANTIVQDSICFFFDTVGNSTQLYLGLNTSLQLQFYAGHSNSFPTLGEAAIGPPSLVSLLPNTWYYIECKVTIAASGGGSIECRLNGTTVISTTGVTTQIDGNANFNSMGFGQNSGLANAPTHLYDDVYIFDTTGPAPLNAYLGDTRINTFMPSADSATAGLNQFSTSPSQGTGSHFQNVKEVPPDDGTSFNFDGNPGDRESYRTPGLVGAAPALINIWARFQKDDSNSRSVAITARNNNIDTIGTTVTVPSSYAYFNQPFPNDPNTGVAWTTTGYGTGTLSNAEFGLKVIS